MMPEVSLMAVLVIVFIADFFTAPRVADVQAGADFKAPRAWFGPLVCVLMLVHTLLNLAPVESAVTFGGMYYTTPSIGIIKSILAFGTLIVLIQSREWMRRPDTFFKEGEFYMLTLATLLGMNMMVSANHFLLFFLGLELASVPMACLVAFDKYRHNSAEAGAKFILTATFSSGVMLYGISLLYGAVGTLYFDDVVMRLSATPMVIVGLVFFVSGLGFKISLVPFHFWTADSYQGAPTTVTGYLSVISKGAAAFTLCTVLMALAFGAVCLIGIAFLLTPFAKVWVSPREVRLCLGKLVLRRIPAENIRSVTGTTREIILRGHDCDLYRLKINLLEGRSLWLDWSTGTEAVLKEQLKDVLFLI